ncbi:hypothetical protein A6M21_08185 [Desulfotomaculum copahuensis]|uniref:Uncharacterized protein n=2 Tax=Desulfotomaculum copahuensis TaxID=1838280 RepID=A0A1B7LFQ3_9FIRM|nr:hypothetical protein A6M21_08185 [Desulfotomaculum copahuensis]
MSMNDTEPADEDNVPAGNTAALGELQAAVLAATGAQVPADFLEDLLREYPEKAIREKIRLMGDMGIGTGIRNVPGLLVTALRENYRHEPGRPRGRGESSVQTVNKRRLKTQKPPASISPGDFVDSGDEERNRKKREILKSLYLS